MRKRRLVFSLSAFILLAVFLMPACDFLNNGDARVTIYFSQSGMALRQMKEPVEVSFLERILRFFVTPAEAAMWDSSHPGSGNFKVTITGEGINRTVTLPAGTASYSATVPSEVNLVFSVIYSYGVTALITNWGGRREAVLRPGAEAVMNISMLPIISIYGDTLDQQQRAMILHDYVDSSLDMGGVITEYRLYRSNVTGGPYRLVTTEPFAGGADDIVVTDPETLSPSQYYYRLSVYGPSGEGLLSDEHPVVIN
jgi:hypothetical protein